MCVLMSGSQENESQGKEVNFFIEKKMFSLKLQKGILNCLNNNNKHSLPIK